MKKLLLIFLVLLSQIGFSQFGYFPNPNQGDIAGGLGLTWIDNQPHYTFHFRPEIAFANFGVGIDLNLEFDTQGNLRKENFNEFSDYLSIIRYVRYGQKHEETYVRLGALDYASLGHGSIMYMYNNSPSYDTRKIGLEFDLDFDKIGFETVYGNFGQSGVAGIRGFVRPLKWGESAPIPIISNLEVGATFATDFNKYAGVIEGTYIDSTNTFQIEKDKGATKIIGLDVGLPISLSSFVTLTPYFDFVKIINFGSGTAAGLMLDLNGFGLVTVRAKLERRWNGDNYLPSYFNSMYEIQRFALDTANGSFYSKAAGLNAFKDVGNGFYGEILVRLLNTFDIIGSYQRLDKNPKSGLLHLAADISPKEGSYVARVGYDKIDIQGEKDLFTLDDRSYLYAEAGYKPYVYLLVSLVYQWTFSPIRDADSKVIDYKPQKKIEPRVSFMYPFDFGPKQPR
ncbi:MAG: hypothetical protein NTX22_17275 [Ignavibacteriales bacterium]|nr:hypothetical protein [Ignavibacteriales bacterium]